MADGLALAAAVEFGPHQKMTLGAELLQVLTAGDKAGMEEILSRQEQDHGGADNDHQQRNGQVAINVHGAPPPLFLLGVASNGNTALHLVARRGHVELAALLCQRAPSLVATRNRCLDTPLHCAAEAGHRDVVAVLLPAMQAGGADEESALRARNQTGATALYEAVRHGHAGVVDLLMTEASHLSSVATEDGISPLYMAAMAGSAEMVRAMLRPSPNGTPSPASSSGPKGRTALHVAATCSKEIAQAILDWEPQGLALLTRVDSSGRTPLHFAVLSRQLDTVQMFLQHGDSSLGLASISDDQGSFPLHIASMIGQTRMIDELVKISPDYCEMVDGKGRNLLHRAVEHGQQRVVRHICQNDMFAMLLNATDFDGNTSLHLAVKYEHPRIVSLLVATTSVKLGIPNKDRLTARDLAERAMELDPKPNFLDSHVLVYDCLAWSEAPTSVDGYMDLYVDAKLAEEEEAFKEKYDKTQSRTVASALIATVTFAAAFTVPGGFVADDHERAGTAILAKRFAFRAFVVSDAMAFLCSIVATCFLIDPYRFRSLYVLASGLVPLGAQFMIAAFAFGFHLVLGSLNRWLIVFVYMLALASVLFAFPGIWSPMHIGLGRAIWRRAGWRGLMNMHESPSSLTQFLFLLSWSFIFINLRRTLCTLLISATFLIAILLSFALPDY